MTHEEAAQYLQYTEPKPYLLPTDQFVSCNEDGGDRILYTVKNIGLYIMSDGFLHSALEVATEDGSHEYIPLTVFSHLHRIGQFYKPSHEEAACVIREIHARNQLADKVLIDRWDEGPED